MSGPIDTQRRWHDMHHPVEAIVRKIWENRVLALVVMGLVAAIEICRYLPVDPNGR